MEIVATGRTSAHLTAAHLQGVEQVDLSTDSPVVQLSRAGGANPPPSTLSPPPHHPGRPKAARAPNVAESVLGAAFRSHSESHEDTHFTL